MKNVIDYETMDWVTEGKRVKAAFEVEVECEFLLINNGSPTPSKVLRPSREKGRTQSHGMRLTARYVPEER